MANKHFNCKPPSSLMYQFDLVDFPKVGLPPTLPGLGQLEGWKCLIQQWRPVPDQMPTDQTPLLWCF